jgi:acetyltransferase-like isoleucine patch superfamily enzyme
MSVQKLGGRYMLKSEREKMTSGEIYNSQTEELIEDRLRAKELLKRFNDAGVREIELRKKTLDELFGSTNGEFYIEQPFFCSYGYNIHWGKNAYANYNLTILDNGRVSVGDNVMIGPSVQLLTACHPLCAEERNTLFEFTRPIIIGDNVWIGGGAVILPGVSIGKNSVIGAGSVVTKDIPDDVVAAGNPCRVIREITVNDKILNHKKP